MPEEIMIILFTKDSQIFEIKGSNLHSWKIFNKYKRVIANKIVLEHHLQVFEMYDQFLLPLHTFKTSNYDQEI